MRGHYFTMNDINEADAIQAGLEEIKGRGTSGKIDPSWIKVTNWSRKRKRNKKLWKTKPGRGRGQVRATATIEDLEKELG